VSSFSTIGTPFLVLSYQPKVGL